MEMAGNKEVPFIRPLVNSAYKTLTKTYVVGTQKNHLNETVLLSTQIIY